MLKPPIHECPICRDNSDKEEFVHSLLQGYRLLRCNKCDVIFCYPFKSPSQNFYTKAQDTSSCYRHSGITEWHVDHPSRRSILFKDGKGKRLLDIGCGNGAFAEYADQMGFLVIGLDMDGTSIELARNRRLSKSTFQLTNLEEFASDPKLSSNFDIITLFEVFEHLDNPDKTLTSVKRLLRPGGFFVGSLPNINRWFMWQLHMDYEMPPYHLTFWTPENWSNILVNRYGFRMAVFESNIYFGYITDCILGRIGFSPHRCGLFGKPFRQVEKIFERIFRKGGSFYFEAQR